MAKRIGTKKYLKAKVAAGEGMIVQEKYINNVVKKVK